MGWGLVWILIKYILQKGIKMTVTIEGKMFGGYQKPDYTNKETGEVKEGKYIVQIMTPQILRNGATKNEIFDVSIPNELVPEYQNRDGETIQVKCNYMSKEKVTFYGVI